LASQERAQGEYGKESLRKRRELVERSFAHCYETGGIGRCTLRGNKNILKRLLTHVGAFNLSLILRKTLGAGTPRELKKLGRGPRFTTFSGCSHARIAHNRAGQSRIDRVIATQSKNRSERSRGRNLWNLRTSTTGCDPSTKKLRTRFRCPQPQSEKGFKFRPRWMGLHRR
jgi:hypothetical protein